MTNLWVADKETYDKLQQLKTFVDFVASLEYATPTDKQKAIKIKTLIENIDKPETFEGWNVCLDIFDRDIQNGINKNGGTYWRKWWVYFEGDTLEIEATTEHTSDPINHFGKDFHFSACIFFKKDIPCERIYLFDDLNNFINDATKYKNYMTETLNDIEIDIDIF
ncbi:MAG: hypothetical protein JST29_06565 [Bacteroidetes bacterium]|nr:hypothetical protein [Bacteroidota bacterium]MBS1591057.1 hypothetical protein [Bacteroidota bacterium]